MELKEMIKVMQHYEKGGEVEYSDDNFETILGRVNNKNTNGLSWDWSSLQYRIKPEKQKVTIEKWLFRDKQGDFLVIEISNADNYKQYEKVKLIETYEVELWKLNY